MGIAWPNFLEQQFEIVQAYDRLGIEATLCPVRLTIEALKSRGRPHLGQNRMQFVIPTHGLHSSPIGNLD